MKHDLTHEDLNVCRQLLCDLTDLRSRLVTMAIRYDERQSRGKRYNHYALAQYLKRIDEVAADIKRGADPRKAIVAGFTGPLLSAMLRAAGFEKPTPDELTGAGKWGYSPVTQEPGQ